MSTPFGDLEPWTIGVDVVDAADEGYAFQSVSGVKHIWCRARNLPHGPSTSSIDLPVRVTYMMMAKRRATTVNADGVKLLGIPSLTSSLSVPTSSLSGPVDMLANDSSSMDTFIVM